MQSLPPAIRDSRPVQVLEQAIDAGRLPHAMLLHGDSLEILECVALALSRVLLEDTGQPERHPDFFTLRPAKKARMIRVGDRNSSEPNTMRALLRDLQQTSNRSGNKVALIYEADRMNDSTANAFLKTLEEPPPGTILLLLTTRPYDLLPTIRSRCFQFRIPLRAMADADAEWDEWKADLRGWMMRLVEPMKDKAVRSDLVMAMYGLIGRFEAYLSNATNVAWKRERENLPETLTEDERIAVESGLRKGVRNRLFIEVEEVARETAHHLSHHIPFPDTSYPRVVGEMEKVAGLMEVHLREEAALEYFLLQNLRIWPLEVVG